MPTWGSVDRTTPWEPPADALPHVKGLTLSAFTRYGAAVAAVQAANVQAGKPANDPKAPWPTLSDYGRKTTPDAKRGKPSGRGGHGK